MNYCKKCGQELFDGAVFCTKCGEKVVTAVEEPAPKVVETEAPAPAAVEVAEAPIESPVVEPQITAPVTATAAAPVKSLFKTRPAKPKDKPIEKTEVKDNRVKMLVMTFFTFVVAIVFPFLTFGNNEVSFELYAIDIVRIARGGSDLLAEFGDTGNGNIDGLKNTVELALSGVYVALMFSFIGFILMVIAAAKNMQKTYRVTNLVVLGICMIMYALGSSKLGESTIGYGLAATMIMLVLSFFIPFSKKNVKK